MNKLLFALPVCLLFAYCSGSRKATTPPAGPGISNVNVITGKDTIKANAITTTPENRDFAYRSTRDTALKGTWILQGLTGADGTWSTTDQWYADTAAVTTDTVMAASAEATAATDAGTTTTTKTKTKGSTTKTKTKTSKSTLRATQSLHKYDS